MLGSIDWKVARNAASGFLAAYGWVAFFCFFYLVISWAGAAPHVPDPSRGLIYPHNEHGTITYFSAFQGTSCALLFGTSPLFFILGIAIAPKKEVVTTSGSLGFSMKWKPDDPRKVQRIGAAIGAIAAPLVTFLFGPTIVTNLNAIGVATGF